MNQNYASLGARFLAAIIDFIILFIVQIVIGFIFGLLLGENAQTVGSAASFGVSLYYWVFYQATTGQTLGKKVMGIQVLTLSGQRPSYMTFILREILGKFISTLILFIGYLFPLWDAKKQALHDKIASTIVVKVGTTPGVTQAVGAPTVQGSAVSVPEVQSAPPQI